jgi:hypothetical protein
VCDARPACLSRWTDVNLVRVDACHGPTQNEPKLEARAPQGLGLFFAFVACLACRQSVGLAPRFLAVLRALVY